MTPFEEVPMPPTLPKSLLDTIGEYGMARTDRVSELTIQHRWELLIAAIKDYALAYGQQCRPAPCPWTPDPDGYWKTACGKSHAFTDGGPTENQHRFCCYCGGAITMKADGRG